MTMTKSNVLAPQLYTDICIVRHACHYAYDSCEPRICYSVKFAISYYNVDELKCKQS